MKITASSRRRQGFHKLSVALTGILWAWVALTGLAAAGQPQLVVTETTRDLGQVFEDQPLSHSFVLKNTGDAPLVIKDIDLDCACSAVDYDRTIVPGASSRVTLSIKPYSVIHRFCKKATVLTNDPRNPSVVLQLCGEALPFVEIRPGHIVRFRGNPEEPQTAEIRLISHQETPLNITGFKTDLDDKIEVKIIPEVAGKIFVVRVSNKIKTNAVYKGKIELATTSDKRPQLILRVFADLYPSSAVNP